MCAYTTHGFMCVVCSKVLQCVLGETTEGLNTSMGGRGGEGRGAVVATKN